MDRRFREFERRAALDTSDRYARIGLWRHRRRVGRSLAAEIKEFGRPRDEALQLEETDREVLKAFRLFTGDLPHARQFEFFTDESRFVAAVAGIQGGKTSIGASKFWRRIISEDIPGAQYWMVAPDSILGRVMRERFHAMAPPGWIQRPREFSIRTMVWHLKNGARVDFRSGERPEKLVGATLNGVWLDEFAQLKPGLWSSSVRGRLAATSGWALFTGTPCGKNWAWDDVWRLTIKGDDKHDPAWAGYTWPSSDSPAISQEEIEAARRTLAKSFFEREWRASWDAFHGQIYALEEGLHILEPYDLFLDPDGYCLMGLDFGFAKPGHLAVLWRSSDGSYDVIDEVHEAGKTDPWWDEAIKAKYEEHTKVDEAGLEVPPVALWCDPSEPQRIMAFSNMGLPAKPARNEVHRGIRLVSSLVTREMFFISKACPHTIREHTGYQWQEDGKGRRRESPVKENDHSCDAVRYAIMGDSTGGVRSKRARRGRPRSRSRRR